MTKVKKLEIWWFLWPPQRSAWSWAGQPRRQWNLSRAIFRRGCAGCRGRLQRVQRSRRCGVFWQGYSTGSVEVTYDYYSAVPEPRTLAAGLAILGYCEINLIRRVQL